MHQTLTYLLSKIIYSIKKKRFSNNNSLFEMDQTNVVPLLESLLGNEINYRLWLQIIV